MRLSFERRHLRSESDVFVDGRWKEDFRMMRNVLDLEGMDLAVFCIYEWKGLEEMNSPAEFDEVPDEILYSRSVIPSMSK
jgi:hypothetical protein